MSASLKELAREWFECVWNRKEESAIYRLLDPKVVGVSEGGRVVGPDEFVEKVHRPLLAAFPDLRIQVDGIVADGSETVTRWSITGTHSGAFLDLPISGRRVTFSGMTWFRFSNGRIIEGADRYNLHALVGYLASGQTSATVLSE